MPTLNWLGKDKVINYSPPFHFLDKIFSVGTSANKIIHGDNLIALKSLLPRYENKIKCIYIDPPYNTGNEGWIYNDNVNSPQIQKWLGQVVGSEDLSRHDKWLCMMFPRLRLLQKLLREDGAIFISIDDNEQAALKFLCDEIFGASNFVKNIAVINNLKGRSDDKYIATAHENLLIYRKENFVTNGVPMPDEYFKEYKLEDSNGKYRLQGLRKRGSNSRREDRPNLFYPFYYDAEKNILSIEKLPNSIEILPRLSDGEDGRWRWGKETASERISELTVQKVKGRGEYDVFQKDYLPNDGTRRVKPKSFWSGAEFSAESGTLTLKSIFGKRVFDTVKSVGLIEYILQQATDKNSIVLDCFAGSGTTAHAVENLNAQDGGSRRFILIENADYAESITAERVRRIGGEFNFYEVGAALFDEDGFINPAVPIEKIFDYVYYSETGKNYTPCAEKNLLGVDNDTAYYFFGGESLSWDTLSKIQTRAGFYTIYAETCNLSEGELAKYKIAFKKIPEAIRRYGGETQ